MSQPSEPILLREDDGGIARLTLNRPQARNALSMALMEALDAQLVAIAADAAVKVVVIAGSGPAFCAGHDLREMRSRPGQAIRTLLALFERRAAVRTLHSG